ncbi:crossover junction endodeoxyribonuclease RuvC [Natronocella acetinitrilica]|jgi:crossover junction endodeoxyribonuclease RuvC|uniref:Crossover junction endodeoxyribonuclease RuvC n=1 Tax=Natronocella acetinitrilica TaxID=414046 RepID=A0AAE3G581_9GAMM|nr:crossover junction endodeoxyribonuclease RuvC [Natronocella acetinitrilica]MCP1674082.1 crossover junction endodeoxyribonuclease RuvC [Natronocella acetinitrilica]
MSRILGIDPGSRVTGFGIVESAGRGFRYVTSGVIRTASATFPERLRIIFEDLTALIHEHQPEALSVEQVHVRHNVSSALKLGQARGAAICAGAVLGLPVHEYTPAEAKQALVGQGSADKQQVQMMVRLLLELPTAPPEDAADALAMALCHLHQSPFSRRVAQATAKQWK